MLSIVLKTTNSMTYGVMAWMDSHGITLIHNYSNTYYTLDTYTSASKQPFPRYTSILHCIFHFMNKKNHSPARLKRLRA